MKSINIKTIAICLLASSAMSIKAGNPDRRGQAGATELLINPWSNTSGWNGVNTASVRGLEAERLNVAGMAFTTKGEIMFSRTAWLSGSGINLNAFGIAHRISESSVLGLTVMNVNFGDIEITNEIFPDGGIGTYSPQFSNIGVSFAKEFSNRIYGGATLRLINQSISDANASGAAFDAGIQYHAGENDRLKFGISLRNIGTPMRFAGDGMAYRGSLNNATFEQTLLQRSAQFELPSLMNIGGSYDLKKTDSYRLTAAANFTSNSFTSDIIGAGLEFDFKNLFAVRGGYNYQGDKNNAYTGLAGGVTFNLPYGEEKLKGFRFDYSYRTTNPFSGTHSFGVLMKF